MSEALPRKRASWLSAPERGSVLGMSMFVWAIGVGGRGLARALLWPVMAYYYVFSPSGRAASRTALARMGAPHGARAVFRHLLTFGQVALDRLLLVQGKTDDLEFDLGPTELLSELQDSETGALLLGAHVGSFEALACMARQYDLQVSAVIDTSASRVFMGVLRRLNPALAERLIDLRNGRLDAIFAIRGRLAAREHVGLLADRCTADERAVVVPFMGQEVRLPAGPFILAATVGCPVYFVAAIYRGGNRYEVHAERFADRIVLPRKDRAEGLRRWATLYATKLEALARKAPTNWFNLYDFWQTDE